MLDYVDRLKYPNSDFKTNSVEIMCATKYN